MNISKISLNRFNNVIKPKSANINKNSAQTTDYKKNYSVQSFGSIFHRNTEFTPEFLTFLYKRGKVTKEDYAQIKKNCPHVIKQAKKYVIDNIKNTPLEDIKPDVLVRYSKAVKEVLDNSFSDDGYKLISVGTSVSAICQILSYLGVDVSFMPLSNVRSACYAGNLQNIKDNQKVIDMFCPDIYKAIDYTIQKGEINDDKDILLFDFTSSGRTLKTLKTAMLKRLGPDFKHHIYQIPIEAIDISENKSVSREEFLDIRDSMSNSTICRIGNVPHFNVANVPDENGKYEYCYDREYYSVDHTTFKIDEDLYKALDEFSTSLARAYSLVCLDILNQEKSKA